MSDVLSDFSGEYDQVQKKAFTKWVNMHLEKVGAIINEFVIIMCTGSSLFTEDCMTVHVC